MRNFNFNVPRPLNEVIVAVEALDIDSGEVVRVSLVGGGEEYLFSRAMDITGNMKAEITVFEVSSRDLDKISTLFENTHGEVAVKIEKTHGSGRVEIGDVAIGID